MPLLLGSWSAVYSLYAIIAVYDGGWGYKHLSHKQVYRAGLWIAYLQHTAVMYVYVVAVSLHVAEVQYT